MTPLDRLLRLLTEGRDELVAESGGMWIYVSVDRESRRPVNAGGVFTSAADAGLAALTDPDDHCEHVAIPLFIQQPVATW